MNVLGLDTATAVSATCLLRADDEAFEVLPDPAALTRPPAHARELLPAIERVMRDAAVGWGEVGAIAVGRGPGAFTGLRIGIATARALGQSHGVELRPVSSLAALAAGIPAPVRMPLIDAKRGELFAAVYENGAERAAPFVGSPEAAAERLASARIAESRALAAGDGSLRFRGVLEAAGVEVAAEGSPAHVVRALHVCRLAARARATPAAAVVPDYLRAPDVQEAT